MPYSIKKSDSKYQVITTDTGKVHGTHPTKDDAMAQMRAMYANMKPKDKATMKKEEMMMKTKWRNMRNGK